MSSESTYYVPEQSKLPLFASITLFLTVFGAAILLNDMKAEVSGSGGLVLGLGLVSFIAVLWVWFSQVIKENRAGMNSAQLKRSYVWAMGWFIFSEVMFFAAFFGALFYIRNLALPWLSGEGDGVMTNAVLWPEFTAQWPLMTTPDQTVAGADATFKGPDQNMSYGDLEGSIWTWLPFWNTVILLTSSVTVHFAHSALKKDKKKPFNSWLGLTVLLGIIFLILQVEEYIVAYNDMGLTLESGIYGTTFFMLTGFHGLHVTMGTIMLLIMWLRSVLKGHFNSKDQFGFEAASWYWHFVDVVWVGLFLFVYIFG